MRGNMILHWMLYHLGLQAARTQLSFPETRELIELAEQATTIVELGVFEGATSKQLRTAMKPDATLVCVDPFFAGSLGISYGYSIARREVSRSSNGSVEFIRKLSYKASPAWIRPIDLLFIDADHAYLAVRRDWNEWSPHVSPGGFVALHDSCEQTGRCGAGDGPVRLVKELLVQDHGFSLQRQVDTLSVFQRKA